MKKLFIGLTILILGFTACSKQEAEVVAGQFIDDYSEKVYEEYKSDNTVALFFHADWCTTCIALEKEINANEDAFQTKAKILKVDFDTESDLKKKYEILLQSTFVFVDSEGNMVKKLAAPTLTEIIESFNQVL